MKKNAIFFGTIFLLVAAIALNSISLVSKLNFKVNAIGDGYIKWVEFDVPYEAMYKALNMDIKSKESGCHLDWVTTLAYLGTKYGGKWKKYKAKDMDQYAEECRNGKTAEELTENMAK